jgi:hypothetical protein
MVAVHVAVGVDVGTFTVSVAALVLVVPQVFAKTARYWWPLSAACVVKLNVRLVAPGTLVNVHGRLSGSMTDGSEGLPL